MTKDWRRIAQANRLEIPDADLDRIAPTLEAMEAAFRPLAQALPPDTDPAFIFRAVEEGE